MNPLEDRIAALEAQVAELTRRLNAFAQMRVDPASGDGQVVETDTNVLLRINALTPNASQVP